MIKVTQIKPCSSGPEGLRNIARMMDEGEIEGEATVVCGAAVFHVGTPDDNKATRDAIFNLTIGLASLSAALIDSTT